MSVPERHSLVFRFASIAAFVSLVTAACAPAQDRSTAQDGSPARAERRLHLERVVIGLDLPVHINAPAGDPRLFVVEQTGRIRIVERGRLLQKPFLDLRDQVSSGSERGLLSVAFHPRFASNRYLFVNYTDRSGDTRVERYRVGSDPNVVDPSSAKLVLHVEQPYSNHNGGLVLFGPDGMLYIGMGDGGSGGDPHGHAQNPGSLLGKMLRIDIDRGDPYAIPADNPFLGRAGVRPEIWATGLRNPWRFAFDPPTGLLYIGDVGQNAWEEVDVVRGQEGGLNYGWARMEGKHCFRSRTCDPQGTTLPAVEYPSSEGCTVIGGLVYRGARMPAFVGHYFYADHCRGWIRSFRYENGRVTDPVRWSVDTDISPTTFGTDAAGELLVASLTGEVYRVVEVRGGAVRR